jgi:hypothetical protein
MLLHPMSSFAPEEITTDVTVWTNESFFIGKTEVYVGVTEDTNVTEAYRTTVQGIITTRIALGGYRLAAVLNELFANNTGPETDGVLGPSWTAVEEWLLLTNIVTLVALGGVTFVLLRKQNELQGKSVNGCCATSQPLVFHAGMDVI